jgi:tetratricopeptide (TPR) repeat protein
MLNRNTTASDAESLTPISFAVFGRPARAFVASVALLCAWIVAGTPWRALAQSTRDLAISGTVVDSAGKPVANAQVRLECECIQGALNAQTDANGGFSFSGLKTGTYSLSAEASGLRSAKATAQPAASPARVQLVLKNEDTAKTAGSFSLAMEFADKPNFTVAGVTDWTAAGGHGSDANLRASEALTRETIALKPGNAPSVAAKLDADTPEWKETEHKLRAALAAAPNNFETNRSLAKFYLRSGRYQDALPILETCYRIDPGNRENEQELAVALLETGDLTAARGHVQSLLAHGENADLHRTTGEIDEKAGDPLAAVHEFELAVRLDPTEPNYFAWGSELLLHRAVWQAQEVFRKGVQVYPKSSRMQAALGAALFAGALYDEAATRLCAASDLNPSDPEPYLFMGKIVMAAPDPLPCVEPKLARFAELQPTNSLAIYYHAMSIWKQSGQSADPQPLDNVESMLKTAVALDPHCSDADLQLGNLSASRRQYDKAIGYYLQALDTNPQLSEAHYRLGTAYDRVGERAKAALEFDVHDKLEKEQAAEVERQRREVKQFLVRVPEQPANPSPR